MIRMPKRLRLLSLAALAALLWAGMPFAGLAQTKEKPLRVGLIEFGRNELNVHLHRSLIEGLRQRGYVEGNNLILEHRYADGAGARVPALAKELAALNLDVIVTTCTPTTQYVAKATQTIPLVMAGVADPVGQRFIASYSRPSGNITGVASQFEDIAAKMLHLLLEAVPKASPVAVLFNPGNPVHKIFLQEIEAAARALNVRVALVGISAQTDLPAEFGALARQGVASLLALPDDPLLTNVRRRIVALAATHRMPSLFGIREAVEDGGLMSYGEPLSEAYFRAAYYVDRIAKGAKPGDLPVEQPTQFEMLVNLKTAKALGLKIPQSILLKATKVIE